ncbi:MAG: hypothetical protein OEU26_09530 [Candidatus Tectomicrobia bacterium]|nr:hypothetical protein [Candidatus Tectomicrobia bacterium]
MPQVVNGYRDTEVRQKAQSDSCTTADEGDLSHLKRWPSPMPIGGLLVSVGHVQDRLLRERFAPDLETDKKCKSHFRVHLHVLSTEFNVLIPLG